MDWDIKDFEIKNHPFEDAMGGKIIQKGFIYKDKFTVHPARFLKEERPYVEFFVTHFDTGVKIYAWKTSEIAVSFTEEIGNLDWSTIGVIKMQPFMSYDLLESVKSLIKKYLKIENDLK